MILISILVIGFFYENEHRSVESNVLRQNYVTVQPLDTSPNKVSFDLKNKSFVSLFWGEAVKNEEYYCGNRHVSENGDEKFEIYKNYVLRYSMIATNITQREIRKNKFVIKQKVSKKDQLRLKKLEPKYCNTEMKVTYNKQYLPVKVELYNIIKKKWRIYTKYTYPSKDTYEKELNECIEAVLNGDFGED